MYFQTVGLPIFFPEPRIGFALNIIIPLFVYAILFSRWQGISATDIKKILTSATLLLLAFFPLELLSHQLFDMAVYLGLPSLPRYIISGFVGIPGNTVMAILMAHAFDKINTSQKKKFVFGWIFFKILFGFLLYFTHSTLICAGYGAYQSRMLCTDRWYYWG